MTSTIQMIIDEFQIVHDHGNNVLKANLCSRLKDANTDLSDTITNIIKDIFQRDLLGSINSGVLKTDQRRKTYFKEHFNYVEPINIYLGRNENRKERYCVYVPIKKTLTSLFKQPSVRIQHDKSVCNDTCPPRNYVLEDIVHGTLYKENSLFKSNSGALSIILYQDAFEVVNPLGSAKKKHKVLGVYFTLANLEPHNRSNIDHMQLVLLCRETDFKLFGQKKVFTELIKDLKDLEQTGIELETGKSLRGTLCCITGDNLGSHALGGFSENFSTVQHFCRYCLITKEEFTQNVIAEGPVRTPEHYDEMAEKNADGSPIDLFDSCGIKFSSLFNTLEYYHVCKPGLPPCLGHDLFEGIVSVDLAMYIAYFIKNNWFTYRTINRTISQFKYLGGDVNNKPNEINTNGVKIGGHAVQNWCLLRLLPLIVCDYIQDQSDDVLQLCLLLRQIVAYICAPVIAHGQIAYLKLLIEEYLDQRKKLFPHVNLKPKHHYLVHYPSLILKFGPLIRLWTLRFESKHTYFKRCARMLGNFKNICHTFAERHQLLQSYYSVGNLFQADI